MLADHAGDLPAAGAAHRLAGAPARGGRSMSAALGRRPHGAPARVYPRRKRRIRGSSIAILVFLGMCAAFVSIPLYVVIVTSFKTDGPDHARRDLRAADAPGRSSPGGRPGPSLLRHDLRRRQGAASSPRCRSCSRAWSSRSRSPAVTGYALALWNVRWAGPLPVRPLHVRLRAVPDHHDPADRAGRQPRASTAAIWAIAIVHACWRCRC